MAEAHLVVRFDAADFIAAARSSVPQLYDALDAERALAAAERLANDELRTQLVDAEAEIINLRAAAHALDLEVQGYRELAQERHRGE